MKQSKQPGNSNEQLVQFRRSDAQRIARTVHAYESGRRGRNPSSLPRAAGGGGGGSLERVRFVGAWVKGQIKNVTLAPGGTATSSESLTVINELRSIQYSSQARVAYVAEIGDQYFMVASEC